MTSKAAGSAVAGGSGVGPSRRTWDVEEYSRKARDRDREERERAEENEERLRKGEKPVKGRKREELPQPTMALQRREEEIDIAKNQGKTLMVENAQGGRKGPGFHCDVCNRTFKDSIAYLDHVNGRLHLRKLGQTTQVERATLEQVRKRLLFWQDKLQNAREGQASEYDFERRLAEIAQEQRREKEERRKKRKEAKERKANGDDTLNDAEAMAAMGFGSFGQTKRR